MSPRDWAEKKKRKKTFWPNQADDVLIGNANRIASTTPRLPTSRRLEVTDRVIGGPQGVVGDQAESRPHPRKGLVKRLIPG